MGNIPAYLVSSFLTEQGPRIAVLLSLALCSLALVVSWLIPGDVGPSTSTGESRSAMGSDVEPDERVARDIESDSPDSSSLKAAQNRLKSVQTFVKDEKPLLVLLLGYFVRMLAFSVTKLQMLYVSQRFNWTIARVRTSNHPASFPAYVVLTSKRRPTSSLWIALYT